MKIKHALELLLLFVASAIAGYALFDMLVTIYSSQQEH